MAAGWLKAGARAVVAEGHFGPAWYVRQLFTTQETVDRIFHDSPTFNDNAFTFASTRTKGATAEMDPDGTPGGYWRAVTGWLDTKTDDIVGATYLGTIDVQGDRHGRDRALLGPRHGCRRRRRPRVEGLRPALSDRPGPRTPGEAPVPVTPPERT